MPLRPNLTQMEELLYFMVIVIIGALIVVPIILLANLSSANRKILDLQKQIRDLDNRLGFIISKTANKQDVQNILTAITNITVESKEKTAKPVEPEIRQEVLPKDTQQESIQKEKAIEIISERQLEEPDKQDISSKPEGIGGKTTPKPETEKATSYAAINKSERSPNVATSPIISSPSQEKERKPKREISGKKLIERIFGENWLSKVGIVTLVLGVGFFVKYAIDQNWINEIGRVGIGVLTGALIIGIAHKLKEKYHVFSSLLVGGGISILYITITLAFREYEIFSQTVSFVLLSAITIFSVILSLFYNRQELAIFSLIGGFCSPLMVSTGSGNYIVLFSFILILNTGMLLVSLMRNWKLIGIVSYVLSLAFYWIWLIFSFDDQFTGATIFASLFFAQFYLLAIIKHFRENKKLSIFQAILILTNNLSILFSLMYIYNYYEYDVKGLAVIAIAVINAIVMLTLFRNAKVDKNLIYLVIGVVMSFVTLAVPIQLKGYVITMFWAAEMVLLLWLWQRSKINIFRLGFLILSLLTIFSYLMDIDSHYISTYYDNPASFINSSFITGIVTIIGFALSLFLLAKEDASDIISIKGRNLFSVKSIKYIFKFILIALIFLVPYLELNYQLSVYTDNTYSFSFRFVTLATYTTWFIAALGILFREKINHAKYYFFFVAIVVYSLVYTYLTTDLRLDIFFRECYSSGYFFIHILSLPAIGYIFYLLIKNIKVIMQKKFKLACWALVILSFIILSVELDNIVVWFVSNPDTYFDRLYDTHTFGYPILWGLIAMALMLWGLSRKEVILRQIALISFGFIIVKFYAYDVWLMSQTGRIVSFVLLGIILLVVSFMQQKIKMLVKEDKEQEIEVNKEQES